MTGALVIPEALSVQFVELDAVHALTVLLRRVVALHAASACCACAVTAPRSSLDARETCPSEDPGAAPAPEAALAVEQRHVDAIKAVQGATRRLSGGQTPIWRQKFSVSAALWRHTRNAGQARQFPSRRSRDGSATAAQTLAAGLKAHGTLASSRPHSFVMSVLSQLRFRIWCERQPFHSGDWSRCRTTRRLRVSSPAHRNCAQDNTAAWA